MFWSTRRLLLLDEDPKYWLPQIEQYVSIFEEPASDGGAVQGGIDAAAGRGPPLNRASML
jgi:hypothetical protein